MPNANYVPPVTAEEAMERIFECGSDITKIRDQLDAADRPDKDWQRRANYALRARQNLRQRLQFSLGQLNRLEKARAQMRFERYFVNEARVQLQPGTYEKIQEAARVRLEGAEMMVEFEDSEGLRETDRALLCQIDGEEVWIPKSVIDDESDVREEGDTGVLIIPEYIAKEKRLI